MIPLTSNLTGRVEFFIIVGTTGNSGQGGGETPGGEPPTGNSGQGGGETPGGEPPTGNSGQGGGEQGKYPKVD